MYLARITPTSLLGKALRAPLRLIPRGAEVRILQGPLRGMRWVAYSGNHAYWLGTYELDKQKLFFSSIEKGSVVYDLGAHVGYYSLLASRAVGAAGRVVCFEPSPRNTGCLRRHLQLNGISNCDIIEAAVSSSDGIAFFEPGPNSCAGSLARESTEATPVRTVSLDRMVFSGEAPPPRVVKCDIEGGEYEALLGARATFERFAPLIFLATHDPAGHRRCCDFLSGMGYQLFALDGTLCDTEFRNCWLPAREDSRFSG